VVRALFERLTGLFETTGSCGGPSSRARVPARRDSLSERPQFADFATKDAGADAARRVGLLLDPHDRIALYDLTATAGEGRAKPRGHQPSAGGRPFNVAGGGPRSDAPDCVQQRMHTRYADNPLWLTEGMAMFFESPTSPAHRLEDGRSAQRPALGQSHLPRPAAPDSLTSLLRSDARFTDAAQMGDAYAEAWALSTLIRPEGSYVDYHRNDRRQPA